jgi:nicotinate-nucleotide adenylyltransferase
MSGERRVGLFGGSFDPIHQGHIAPVQMARQALAIERVLYLPTAHPPHKPEHVMAPPLARYAMVELALLGQSGLYASSFELTHERPAYTIDTVAHFRRELPGCRLFLLIGSDSFIELDQWVRWREIVAAVELVVLARPGWQVGARPISPELQQLVGDPRVHLLQTPPVEASSTRLRELLRHGEAPPPGWVPPLVVDYIRKYTLYR